MARTRRGYGPRMVRNVGLEEELLLLDHSRDVPGVVDDLIDRTEASWDASDLP